MSEEIQMDESRTTTTNPAVQIVPAPTDAIVESWVSQWFHNLGLDTSLQNRIRQAADDLKSRLAGRKE